ncbi:hypothetical protein RclHR1_15920008 [Rhizophagus clarus]|uniref:Uncharacterized protein n=1 Tax=Rhizophagus clarus TaxID=94130 RepID=A0A2Z6R938_9GLOM|nr:hypothetical protein RclHR1_15920008 [Rhizophagus clarus]
MAIPPIPSSALSLINNIFGKFFVNKIKININNTQSRNTLHHGKRFLGNTLIKPLPVTINRREEGFAYVSRLLFHVIIRLSQLYYLMYYREFKSTIKKACGLITYEIDDKRKDDLPLLLIVGWKISIIGKNKWFVFIGCETDPDFPDFPNERFMKEYLKENGNTGSNTLDFEAHSISIDGSISDGNNAQLNIDIREMNSGVFEAIRRLL